MSKADKFSWKVKGQQAMEVTHKQKAKIGLNNSQKDRVQKAKAGLDTKVNRWKVIVKRNSTKKTVLR